MSDRRITQAVNTETGQIIPGWVEKLPPVYVGSRVRLCFGAGGGTGTITKFDSFRWRVKVRYWWGGWKWCSVTEVEPLKPEQRTEGT